MKIKLQVYLIIICFNLAACSNNSIKHPVIEKGILDLTGFDLKNNIIPLHGKIEFYWKQFLNPEDFINSDTLVVQNYIDFPCSWNRSAIRNNGKKEIIKGFGYATFKFKIKLKNDGLYSLKINDHYSAIKIWVDGIARIETGKLGGSESEEIPKKFKRTIPIKSDNQTVDILIQLSNFHHSEGGILEPYYFGLAEDMQKQASNLLIFQFFIAGSIFIISFYYLIIYLWRKKDKSSLFFSAICFIVCLRFIEFGEMPLSKIFPDFLSWILLMKTLYFSHFILVPLILHYIYELYPLDSSKKTVISFDIIVGTIILIILITPVFIFTQLIYLLYILIIIVSTYVFITLSKTVKNKRLNAKTFLAAFIIFFGFILNDILYSSNFIFTNYLESIGLIIFILFQSAILAKNLMLSFTEVESLSIKLEKHKLSLENTIKERTIELEKLLKEKDKFISILAHDLKTPFTTSITTCDFLINNLDDFQEDKVKLILESLKQTSYKGFNLLNNMLEWSRSQSGKTNFSPDNENILLIFREAVEQLKESAGLKNIKININCAGDATALVDKNLFALIIRNLLSNAIKFSFKNGTINLNCHTDNNKIIIEIADCGTGMTAGKIKTIFNGDSKNISLGTDGEEGSGFGLLLCKEYLDKHKAKIDIVSEPGKGSVFKITLPV